MICWGATEDDIARDLSALLKSQPTKQVKQ